MVVRCRLAREGVTRPYNRADVMDANRNTLWIFYTDVNINMRVVGSNLKGSRALSADDDATILLLGGLELRKVT